jgi:hypothetical protein
MILVETVRNITGMSIVRDFDKLKRFNLEQLYAEYQVSQKQVKSPKANDTNAKEEIVSPNSDQRDRKEDTEEKSTGIDTL